MSAVTAEQTAPMSMQQAADAARAQLAAASSAEPPAEPSTEEAPPAETPETTPPAEETQEAEGQPQEPEQAAATEDAQFLTPEEMAKLQPKQQEFVRKAMKTFTQKTQALAAERKALEQYQPLIDALQRDPKGTIAELAKQHGIVPTATPGEQAAEAVADEVAQAINALPAEVQDLLAPAIKALGQGMLRRIESVVKPIEQRTNIINEERIESSVQASLEAFTAKYPDWKQYEGEMTALAKQFQPSAEVDAIDYMTTLYKVVTHGRTGAAETKKVVERLKKAANSAEPVTSGVQNDRVEHALPPPEKRGMADAFAAAKRGELWQR